MNITFKLNRDFEKTLKTLSDKYGEDFEILNGIHESQLNFSDFVDGFIDKKVADVTIDANANASNKDIRSLLSERGKSEDKLFALNKIFFDIKKRYNLKTAREWLETEYNGGFYLHDAPTATFLPYCYAYDLTRLATEGLFFLSNYNAKPPKHLTTFIDDVIEYISYMSNRSSGAVGIPNILIWTYYFWKKDCENGYVIKDSDYYIRQSFQKLIYRLNQPFMRIDQTAFVNVSIFDHNYIESLFGGIQFPDGSYLIDNVEEIIRHEKIFMEVVSEIRSENLFTFPVLTYSLLKRNDISESEKEEMIRTKNYDVFVDKEFARWCSDHNVLWNDSNFFISEDVTTLSNCCRLLSDTTKLSGFINSIGGTALSIGSVKVNTINLMRIALETNCDEKKYLNILRKKTVLCCKALETIRHIIKRNVEKGLLPNYQDGAVEMDKQYCTIGILGLYEVIEAFGYTTIDEFGCVSYTDEGIEFASKIFEVLNDVKDNFTNDFSFNIESVPAERAAIILCQKDNLLYSLKDKFIYSNQWIPLSVKCSIKEKLRLSSILDIKCSGGSISHINLEANFPDKEAAWDMLNKIALENVIYFAFNTRINECENHHGFVGTDICPVCGKSVFDTYQRIVGYLVPTRAYSKDRFKEFTTRQWYEYAEMVRS
ncbi:MAG: anaerobic ribonucleoside-triphosphate reductase [Alphaproteobacteria bacterium]|nr:anaerobic ribonucleoside-triphosphate reductase [Alphaproteobacteria bacterium]